MMTRGGRHVNVYCTEPAVIIGFIGAASVVLKAINEEVGRREVL